MTVLILHVNRSKQNCQTQQERAIFSSWNNLGSVDHLSGTMHIAHQLYNVQWHGTHSTMYTSNCALYNETQYTLQFTLKLCPVQCNTVRFIVYTINFALYNVTQCALQCTLLTVLCTM